MTQEQARLAVAAAGHTIAASVYASYESGTKVPSRKDLPALERFWGSPSERPQATETNDGVAAAIDRQTDVLRAILGVLSGQPPATEHAQAWAQAELERVMAASPSPLPTERRAVPRD